MRAQQSILDLKELVTSQVPNNLTQGTSSVASEIYVAQWDELLVGMRRNLIVEASREAGDASGGAFTSLQVWIRAYLRADIALAHPAHFVVITASCRRRCGLPGDPPLPAGPRLSICLA